jgi:prepilin-type N-terminal cleavage/methylation domain-containing protein
MAPIREQGISLLEVMIAITIMAIASLGIAAAMVHYSGQSASLTQTVTARQSAQNGLYQDGSDGSVTATVQVTTPTASTESVTVQTLSGNAPEVSEYDAYP